MQFRGESVISVTGKYLYNVLYRSNIPYKKYNEPLRWDHKSTWDCIYLKNGERLFLNLLTDKGKIINPKNGTVSAKYIIDYLQKKSIDGIGKPKLSDSWSHSYYALYYKW